MRWWRFGPGIGRTAASGSASGPAIATADRCLRAPFLRLAGDERQPRQVFRQQLATFGSDQPITEERKAGPRAGQVDTVVWVELNLAAISSLAGVSGSRQEPSQRCLPHRKRPASNALILEDMDGVSLASSWQLPSTKDARYFRKSTKDARYPLKVTKDARHFQKYINNAQQFRKPIKHAHDCRGFIRIAN